MRRGVTLIFSQLREEELYPSANQERRNFTPQPIKRGGTLTLS